MISTSETVEKLTVLVGSAFASSINPQAIKDGTMLLFYGFRLLLAVLPKI